MLHWAASMTDEEEEEEVKYFPPTPQQQLPTPFGHAPFSALPNGSTNCPLQQQEAFGMPSTTPGWMMPSACLAPNQATNYMGFSVAPASTSSFGSTGSFNWPQTSVAASSQGFTSPSYTQFGGCSATPSSFSALPSSTLPTSFFSTATTIAPMPASFASNFTSSMSAAPPKFGGSIYHQAGSASPISTSNVFPAFANARKRKAQVAKMDVSATPAENSNNRVGTPIVAHFEVKRMRLVEPLVVHSSASGEATIPLIASDLFAEEGGHMFQVKTLTGRLLDVYLNLDDTMQQVKQSIEEKSGIPVVQQRLIFGGKQMADSKTLRDYKVCPGGMIHLVLALRGGSCIEESDEERWRKNLCRYFGIGG